MDHGSWYGQFVVICTDGIDKLQHINIPQPFHLGGDVVRDAASEATGAVFVGTQVFHALHEVLHIDCLAPLQGGHARHAVVQQSQQTCDSGDTPELTKIVNSPAICTDQLHWSVVLELNDAYEGLVSPIIQFLGGGESVKAVP